MSLIKYWITVEITVKAFWFAVVNIIILEIFSVYVHEYPSPLQYKQRIIPHIEELVTAFRAVSSSFSFGSVQQPLFFVLVILKQFIAKRVHQYHF